MPSNRSWEIPPTFRIDLDIPAAHRWSHVIKEYLPVLRDLVDYIHETEVGEFGSYLGPVIRRRVAWLSNKFIDVELKEELEGIALQTDALGLTYDKLLVLNMGYDCLARCTSAVCGGSDTAPLHLRNMDWDAEAFWPLTINVEFIRSGEVVFKGTTQVGFVGMTTGMREASWSVSLNFRQVGRAHSILFNFTLLLRRGVPISFLLRRCLQDVSDFRSALDQLRDARIMAPCYLTIAGAAPGEGVVLERSRLSVDRCQALDDAWVCAPRIEFDSEICVITNLDGCRTSFDFTEGSADMRWAENDPLLLSALERRVKAVEMIRACAGDAEGALQFIDGFRIMGTAPICNDQTVYTCVMRPSDSSYASRAILKWEEYVRDVDNSAFEEFRDTTTYACTKSLQLINDRRGEKWPSLLEVIKQ